MENEYKGSSNDLNNSGRTSINGRGKELAPAGKKRGYDLFFRAVAAVLSLAAAVVLGVDQQTKTVALTLVPLLPAVDVSVTAKWHYLSASVYFVVVNAVACAYGTISLFLRLSRKGGIAMIVTIFDLMMVVLLFSGIGATLAVGLISYRGNSHVRWQKVCNVVGKFCRQAVAAVGLSCVASLVFFLLVLIAILNLHKKH